MRLALAAPARVAALALLDTSAEAETVTKRVRNRAFLALHRRAGIPYALYRSRIAPEMFGPRTLATRPDLVEGAYHRAMGFDRDGVSRAALAVVVHRDSVLDELGAITAPTLVIVGRDDRALPPERSANIARAIAGAELEIVEGVGHMSAIEDPAAVNARLLPFVTRHVA